MQQNKAENTGAKIWNSVPPDIRKLSKHNFKTKQHKALHHLRIQVYINVEASTLISKLLQYS